MALHPGEIPVDEDLVRRLLRQQRPDLADLPIDRIGGGTDNTVWRLGTDLVARFPRTAEKVAPLLKELVWLPRLQPHLTHRIPAPAHAGRPAPGFPFPWAVLTWTEGGAPSEQTVNDWVGYGIDLARFVASLRAADTCDAEAAGDLTWYRGGSLQPMRGEVADAFAGARRLLPDLDWDLLGQLWREALELPAPRGPLRWLHGDLRPANLLVQQGRLHGVLDFGSLSLGHPDAEHVVAWDMPADGRQAYLSSSAVEEPTWRRARGWAIALSVGGVCAYWDRLPSLAAESAARLRAVADDDSR